LASSINIVKVVYNLLTYVVHRGSCLLRIFNIFYFYNIFLDRNDLKVVEQRGKVLKLRFLLAYSCVHI